MIGTLLNNRYRLDAELGQGGMGVVYRAHDTLLERDVAVKVVADIGLGTEGRARLLHEARAVAQLSHPNIITIFDAGEANNRPFIVMELLPGKSLFDRKSDSLATTIQIMEQVCAALAHAHQHGIVHRDLKPENVILCEDGTAKLTDFGLARSMASRLTAEGTITGTVFYLAPEQALGLPLDGRADLYALGVMLYELTAGRLPFAADDPLSVIAQHLYAPVVAPSTYNAAIPPALDALIAQLLSKQPADRPASALDVRHALEDIERGLIAGPPAAEPAGELLAPELSPLARLALGRPVGRERELAQAKALWRQVTTQPGDVYVLLISGEPGVGKTPLVREIKALAGVSGGRVLSAECYAEGSAPYVPIAQLVRDALTGQPARPSSAVRLRHQPPLTEKAEPGRPPLPEPVLAHLLTLVPDLYDRYPHVSPHPALDPQSQQQRLLEDLVMLFSALAAEAPVLVVVEDIHWADGGTLAALRHLARRSRAAALPLLLLMTYRETELANACCLEEMLLDLSRERLAMRIKLPRLNREQTQEVLTTMFGQEIAPDFVDGIYRETEGNLFFIEEMCKSLIEAGEIYREGGRWQRKAAPSAVQLPQSVRGTIQARVARLPEPAQDVLRLAAIVGREFDFGTLQKASDQDEETLIAALELAERAQLIHEVARAPGRGSPGGDGREAFAFAHTLIPAALRESVSGLRRRRLHRRVAAAIEALRPDDAAALAYHYGEAGDDDRARAYYVRAGDRAAAVYANEDAIRLYTEALALAHDEQERFDLLARRARVYDLIARREAQAADAEAMLALAETLKDEARRCDALLALTDVYQDTDYVRAQGLAEQAVALARELGDPVREAHALQRLGWITLELGNAAAARQALEAAVERFKQADLIAEAANSLHILSLVLGSRGLGDVGASQQAAEEAINLSRRAGDRRQEAHSLRRLAIVLDSQGRLDEALACAEKALALHRELGDREGECHALNIVGLIRGWQGRPDEGDAYIMRSLQVGEAIGSVAGTSNAAGNYIWMHYERLGELQEGLAFAEAQQAKAQRMGDLYGVTLLDVRKAETLFYLGQYTRGIELLDAVVPAVERLGASGLYTKVLAIRGRQKAELGHFDRAEQDVTAAYKHLEAQGALQPVERAWYLDFLVSKALHQAREGAALTERQALLRSGLENAEAALRLLTGLLDSESRLFMAQVLMRAGQLHLALGEPEAAVARSAEAVRLMDTFPSFPGRAELLWTAASALRAAGREAEADDHLRRAHDWVMHVADKLTDESLRRSWLENVRPNREIVAAWADRQGA